MKYSDHPWHTIVDLPGSYHNGAGGLSFANGHAEVHVWLNAVTKRPFMKGETWSGWGDHRRAPGHAVVERADYY